MGVTTPPGGLEVQVRILADPLTIPKFIGWSIDGRRQ